MLWSPPAEGLQGALARKAALDSRLKRLKVVWMSTQLLSRLPPCQLRRGSGSGIPRERSLASIFMGVWREQSGEKNALDTERVGGKGQAAGKSQARGTAGIPPAPGHPEDRARWGCIPKEKADLGPF